MKRRHPITLLEVMLSLGLLTMLLSTLFFWYSRLMVQKKELEHLKWPLMEERYAEQRLATILPKVKAPLLTTKEGSFVFLFDRGIYSNPLLSGTVLGRLYHDTRYNRLCLGVWPAPEKGEAPLKAPSQTFILMDKVSKFSVKFYPASFDREKPIQWQATWLAEEQALPSMIKLEVTREATVGFKSRPITYCFDLLHPIEVNET